MNIIEECVVVISRSASSAESILYPERFMSRPFCKYKSEAQVVSNEWRIEDDSLIVVMLSSLGRCRP